MSLLLLIIIKSSLAQDKPYKKPPAKDTIMAHKKEALIKKNGSGKVMKSNTDNMPYLSSDTNVNDRIPKANTINNSKMPVKKLGADTTLPNKDTTNGKKSWKALPQKPKVDTI